MNAVPYRCSIYRPSALSNMQFEESLPSVVKFLVKPTFEESYKIQEATKVAYIGGAGIALGDSSECLYIAGARY